MHRAILEACLPCLAALVVAFVALRLVVRASGARVNWRRLRELHQCQDGGVQSLAFVVTLPLFVVIVQFIVQVSQLMVGTMIVNYAAFAAARSACVWIPDTVEASAVIPEVSNEIPTAVFEPLVPESRPLLLTFDQQAIRPADANAIIWQFRAGSDVPSAKYANIYTAAAMACLPIAPSRDLGFDDRLQNDRIAQVINTLYRSLDPASERNARIPPRIDNKVRYSFRNTSVRLEFVDKNSTVGPTYNPWPNPVVMTPDGPVEVHRWQPNEIGWQDPITVTVTHNFALLPGPGRFLAKYLVRADGRPDTISPRIDSSQNRNRETVHTTAIWATATMTSEGLRSVIPYVQATH